MSPNSVCAGRLLSHLDRWKNKEQPLRAGIYISGTAIGSLAGQGVDFGAVRIQGAYATSPWKWIYVILGSVTIGYGVLAMLVFPATPMKAWFLTAREKEIAVRRLAQNNTGIQTRKFKWKQVKEAFTDPQLYIFGIYSFTFAFVNNAIGRWVKGMPLSCFDSRC
jgi:ACS family allantoate permease-like MFS transporter